VVTPVTPRLRQIRLRHMVTPVTPNTVTPHSYATWLRRLRYRLRQIRLRHIVAPHVVTPRLRHMVTPNSVTSHSCATCGYATVTPRLRQTRLRHIVTPRGYAGYAKFRLRHIVTPHVVTPRLRQIRLCHMATLHTERRRSASLRHPASLLASLHDVTT